jgi:membrane protein DedA with SNARE-associated domain
VIGAIERNALNFAFAGGALGAVVGCMLGFFIGRRRKAAGMNSPVQ